MASKLVFALLATCATANPASAATTLVDFSLNGGSSVASGSFSYDSALTGLLTYADLDSFSFDAGSNVYDLAFVNSGSFSPYRYFGYNATSGMFQSADIAGYPQVLSAIKNDYASGFFVRRDAAFTILADYRVGSNISFDSISTKIGVSAVPEPSTWALMILGFGAVGGAMRSRNQRTRVTFATAAA